MRDTNRVVAVVAALVLALTVACVKNYYPNGQKPDDTTTSPTTPSPPLALHTIEFRALGTATRARLTYGSAQDGTTEWTGDLPWAASVTTRRATLFVYINGEALAFGEVRVQIFIDGELFREAAISDFGTAQASGTLQLNAAGQLVEAPGR